MEDFLLLGQIPGTNVVITFWQWAVIFGLVFLVVLVRVELHRNRNLKLALASARKLMSKRVDPNLLDQAAI
jgi:hypothetical protein